MLKSFPSTIVVIVFLSLNYFYHLCAFVGPSDCAVVLYIYHLDNLTLVFTHSSLQCTCMHVTL